MKENFLEKIKSELKEKGFKVEAGYTFLRKEGEWEEREIYFIYPSTDWKPKKKFVFFEEHFTEKAKERLFENLKKAFPGV